jgi:hypothetical protein
LQKLTDVTINGSRGMNSKMDIMIERQNENTAILKEFKKESNKSKMK